LGTTITATKAPTCAGAFAVRDTAYSAHAVGGAMAYSAAPFGGTGLPVGIELRLRPVDLMADIRVEAAGTDVQLNSDTPGDLPPRDPLS
jgi:hypothetical protein